VALSGATRPERSAAEPSKAQCEERNNAYPDYQDRKRYGIVVEPIPTKYTHDASPYPNTKAILLCGPCWPVMASFLVAPQDKMVQSMRAAGILQIALALLDDSTHRPAREIKSGSLPGFSEKKAPPPVRI
jgi:hypothetical protein